MKCETCLFENVEGTRYCQCCGKRLRARGPLFTWGDIKPWAGAGQRSTSMAPLKAMAVERQTEELGEVTVCQAPVKVSPVGDGHWYYPGCEELNGKLVLTCKGCRCDFT